MEAQRGRWRELARGLHGHLDLPSAETVVTPGDVDVAGWVFHERWPVDRVVVMVDGAILGTADLEEVREDVGAAYPAHGHAARSGWATRVSLPPHADGEVTISVLALVSPPSEHATLLGGLVGFGEHTMRVEPHPQAHGQLTPPGPVLPGYAEVTGAARHPAGLSRVEVSVDGGAPVRARHSLPGRAGFLRDPAEGECDGFQAFVVVPDGRESVRIAADVVGADGTRLALTPLEVPVAPVVDAPFPDERRRTLESRLLRQARALGAEADGPPRVLVATHDLSWGGAQLYLLLLVRALRERGLDLCLVSGAGGVQVEELERELDVPVLVVGRAGDREELEGLRLQIASFAAGHKVVGCLANTLLAFPAVSAMQTLGIPVSWVVHESFTPRSFLRQYHGRRLPDDVAVVLEDALRRCEEVVFVSEATRALHAPYLTPGAGVVVPYGPDLAAVDRAVAAEDRASVRDRLGLGAGSRVLLCVGTVEPRKGQLALVRAFGRLPSDVRAGAELVLVGAREDDYAAAVRSHLEETGLEGVRVVAAGPDVLPWYVAADVQVSASDVESLPRTMLEAMAVGLPVAATDVFGVGELVVDGVTGFTCEPSDLSAITELLRRALTASDEELRTLGGAARRLVRERYDPSGYVSHFARRAAQWLAAADG